MSEQEGNRNNPYSFDDYLLVRDGFNYYRGELLKFRKLLREFGKRGEQIVNEVVPA
ncbi:MAG: hypothetical protein ACTSU5_01075 [Promethearchaeota archaeon]